MILMNVKAMPANNIDSSCHYSLFNQSDFVLIASGHTNEHTYQLLRQKWSQIKVILSNQDLKGRYVPIDDVINFI